ncbi:MAG: sporulation protein YqfD [Clostridia bacterium]|jgi:similar to stage IV sporulation protein|nr:sporulation protein YqfD [Clostridia bacterium]
MFIKILINYLIGYINVSIEGYYIERFINICISKKILLWNLKRKKSSFLYANISLREFKKIKQIAKTTKCRIKIEEKKGMPFLLNRYKKRKIFIVLLLLIIVSIITLSNFVWNIEVIGNEKINQDEIIKQLEEKGVKIGISKQKIDSKKIINDIRLQRDDIAWMGIKVKGTNVVVEIVESDKKPEIIDEEQYCNIISDKEGIVTKINAQNGTALVKTGDIIKKGNILIGGWLEGKYTGTRYVHAKGEVQARIWYSKKEKMSLNMQIEEKTGRIEKNYGMNINNLKINLPKALPKFQNYDTIIENKKLKLFSNLYFPIEFTKIVYEEKQKIEIKYTPEEAKQILLKKLEEELKKEIKDVENIVNTQINYNQGNNEIEVELIYEVLENIGTKEKILF